MGCKRDIWKEMRSFIACLAVFQLLLLGCGYSEPEVAELSETEEPEPIREPIERFGLMWEEFRADSGQVEDGQSLSHLLGPAGVRSADIYKIAEASRESYDVRNIRAGKPWWILYDGDTAQPARYFIYEQNALRYVKFSLREPFEITEETQPSDTLIQRATGTIESSLYVDLERIGASTNLALAMANVYAWTIDFSRLQQGDSFDVLYERVFVNGEPIGMPKVMACEFQHRGKILPAYRFDQGEGVDYFDAEGNSLRKAFLKAPVEFSRIASRYNLKRFHPILKKTKPHLGTDYAAAMGTPIIAVGNGVVTKSTYSSGNGNYVKIRHNSTYETQYLHMSKRAVSVGESVSQGQVIGYVGSTGLSTGPHVCFRFWKNGKQVDHLKEEFPPSNPVKEEEKAQFLALVADWQAKMQNADFGRTGEGL